MSSASTLPSQNPNNLYKFQFDDITTQASQGLPSARCNHGCIAIGKYFYVVGGRGEGDDQRFNDVHVLDTESMQWKRVEAIGEIPPVSSSFTLSHVGDFVYLFGGKSNNTYLNSVFAFQHKISYNGLTAEETHTIVWRDVHALGEKPSPRYLHSACVVGKKIFIFGGVAADDVCLNDVHIFNTRTSKWLHFKTKGVPPTARARHSCCLSGNRMFVIGGMDSLGSNIYDMHALNIDCLTWSRVETNLEMIPPIAGATTLQFGSKLVMFGGLSDKHRPEGESTNDLYVFDALLSVWYKAHVPDETALPEARNGHRGAVIPGTSKVIFFGGWHCRFLGDLLLLETNITDTFQVNYQTTSFNKSSAFFAYDSERRRRFSIFDVEIIHTNDGNGNANSSGAASASKSVLGTTKSTV